MIYDNVISHLCWNRYMTTHNMYLVSSTIFWEMHFCAPFLTLGGVPSVVGFPHCAWSGEGLFKAPSLSRTNVQRLGLEPGTFWLQTVGSTAPPGPRFHSLLLWVCVNLHKPIWKISSLLSLPVAFAMYMIKTLCSCHEIQIVLLWLSCT